MVSLLLKLGAIASAPRKVRILFSFIIRSLLTTVSDYRVHFMIVNGRLLCTVLQGEETKQ